MARYSKKPLEKTFTIKIDEDDSFTVTIRQARMGDVIKRNELFSETSLVINDQLLGQEIKQDVNPSEIQRYEVFLTMTECTLTTDEDEPWFVFTNGRLERLNFERDYNSLPVEIAGAIHDKVLELNPQWSNQNQNTGE